MLFRQISATMKLVQVQEKHSRAINVMECAAFDDDTRLSCLLGRMNGIGGRQQRSREISLMTKR